VPGIRDKVAGSYRDASRWAISFVVNDRENSPDSPVVQSTEQRDLNHPPDEPPVVARLVIEIRSDGTRTIARGALEDQTTGQKVALRAEGTTPSHLASSLVSSLIKLPLFGVARDAPSMVRGAIKALLPGRSKSKK
jgi:hypothetical protein